MKKFDNAFDCSDSTIVANDDTDITDLDKSRTELLAIKMFPADQFCLLKHSVSSPKIP